MEIKIDELIAHQEQLIADRHGRKWVLALQVILSLLLIGSTFVFNSYYVLILFATTINSCLATANYCMIKDMRQEIENISVIIQHFKDYQQSQDIFNEKFYE